MVSVANNSLNCQEVCTNRDTTVFSFTDIKVINLLFFSQIPLVEQHYATEFSPYLKPTYKVERVSGDSLLKISFAKIVQRNDILICTAQILENYLERANSGEDEGVKLSGTIFYINILKLFKHKSLMVLLFFAFSLI